VPIPDLAPPNVTRLLAPLACARLAEDVPPEDAPKAIGAHENALARTSLASEVEALYRKHKDLVFRLSLRYGKGNVAWAEDITQEVFIDLLKALPELDCRDDLGGWLYRATTNRCFWRLRRERLRSLAPIRWLLGEPAHAPPQPDALAIARDDLRRAAEALSVLPAKEQIAFSMYYLDGKEQEEIGQVLGHSKGYVCKLIQRACPRLRGGSGARWRLRSPRRAYLSCPSATTRPTRAPGSSRPRPRTLPPASILSRRTRARTNREKRPLRARPIRLSPRRPIHDLRRRIFPSRSRRHRWSRAFTERSSEGSTLLRIR
jgi:RNA polymerase sigma-70 factor, ECF subfamily